MELRNFSQLHFIQTIKDGSAVKAQNIFRGRPVLRFKMLKDIYASEDAKNHRPSSELHPKYKFEDLQFEYDRFEVKAPFLPFAERTLNDDFSELGCHGSNIEQNDLDDTDFGTMTLKEIKKRCKAKKRKRSKYVETSEHEVNSYYSSKAYEPKFQPMEDDYDFDEPLSKWKAKLESKVKAKKRKAKYVSASSSSALVKSEQILDDEALPLSVVDLPATVVMKAEPLETDYSTCQTLACTSSNISFTFSEEGIFYPLVINNIVNTGDECVTETGVSIPPLEASHCYALTQVPHEYVDSDGPIDHIDLGEETTKIDVSETTRQQFPPGSGLEDEECFYNALSSDECLQTVSSVGNVNTLERDELQIFSLRDEMIWKNDSRIQLQEADMTICCSRRCTSQSHDGVDCISGHGNRKDLSSSSEASGISSTLKNCSLLSEDVKSSSGDLTSVFDSGTEDDLPSDSEVCALSSPVKNFSLPLNSEVTVISNPVKGCSAPRIPSLRVTEDSRAALVTESPDPIKEMESIVPVCAASRRNIMEAHNIDATNELTRPGSYESGHPLKLQHSPKRLFPSRRVISPPSQKRLQQILECIELEDDEDYKCKAKSHFEKHTEDKIGRAERRHQNRASEVTTSHKHILRKPRNVKKAMHPKGPTEVYQISREAPHVSMLCNSIESCAQNAIAFSQRQMHDIDRLAVRLLDELKSMKEIVEERLQSDHHEAVPFKAEKAQRAVKNATKVEETTRRWLSIMARDCSRFCKIMVHAEKGSANGGSAVNRKRKIIFADEVGKELCHVKLFEVERLCALSPAGTI